MKNNLVKLSQLSKNQTGIIATIDEYLLNQQVGLEHGELKRRFVEMGFMPGVKLRVLHFGPITHDPIAVNLGDHDYVVALRKNEASTIMVELDR